MLGRVTMHAGQLPVSAGMVAALMAAQFPQWGGLPVRELATGGTVNAIFRIGDQFAARFRLQPADASEARAALEAESAAARLLATYTRFPVPVLVAIGEPGEGYPLPWSVQTWLSGVTGFDADPGGSAAFAEDLAEFIAGVRSIPTGGRTFAGRGRGGNLKDHDEWLSECFARSRGLLDVPRLRALWAELRELPGSGPDVMNHGDLTPGNVLISGGPDSAGPGSRRLGGVLDVGTLGPADPALDLISAWNLLDAGPRAVLRARLDVGDAEWERGRAWAFQQAMGLVWYYAESNPVMSRLGRITLARILA